MIIVSFGYILPEIVTPLVTFLAIVISILPAFANRIYDSVARGK